MQILTEDGELISADLKRVRDEFIAVVELEDSDCKLYLMPDAFVANPSAYAIEQFRASLGG